MEVGDGVREQTRNDSILEFGDLSNGKRITMIELELTVVEVGDR